MKRKNISIMLVFVMLLSTVASLSGCGNNQTSGGNGDESGEITLTVTVNSTELGDINLYVRYCSARHLGQPKRRHRPQHWFLSFRGPSGEVRQE